MDCRLSKNYDEALDALERRAQQLFDAAYQIVERHWQLVRSMEAKHRGWENMSNLQLRCEKVGNSIRADWCGIKWIGSKAEGTRRSVRIFIAKPKGAHTYTLSKLFAFAKEWEKPMIENTEAQLAAIRREASQLVKAITAVRNVKRGVLRDGTGRDES